MQISVTVKDVIKKGTGQRRSLDDKVEVGLVRYFFFFNPPKLHILHLVAYKSPCAVCLKALLAPGTVNLIVVHLKMGEKGEKMELSDWHWSSGEAASAEFLQGFLFCMENTEDSSLR